MVPNWITLPIRSIVIQLHKHVDVIKWKHFPRYWPFVRGIHRSPVNSPHKGQWRGALMVFFICTLNERLSKQSRGWLFRSQSHSLWRHCNEICTILSYPLIYCLSLLVTNIQDRVQGARRCAWLNLTTQFQFHTMYRHFPKIGTYKSAQPISVEHTRPPICVCNRHHTAHWPPERSTQISSFLTFR